MWALIDQLVQQGVVDFFLAPGSRSTPLALAASRHPQAKIHTHFDERGLGFFALGCALATQKPTAIIVTSGTAVGNLLPAVMEAHHSSTPLILLTADRPAELRETSANQTTDQIKIFQNFVRWQCDFDSEMQPKAIRSKAAQAVYRATHPHPGPVHINCPLREPLYPVSFDFVQGTPIVIESTLTSICAPKQLPSKGIILLGRSNETEEALHIAKQLGWPVFADLLSSARLDVSKEQIRHFDWLLTEAPRPECVIHFGERLTSKRLMEWLQDSPPTHYWHVSPHSHWLDPSHLITGRIHGPIGSTNFYAEIDLDWLPQWIALDKQAEEKLHASKQTTSFTETLAMQLLKEMNLEEWAIFLGNSMPIREGDWFLFPEKSKGFFANRGLSGIDGNLATIAGISVGLDAPVFAIVGDLTALHDLNSLALLHHLPIILLISNNNGGGIFSHLAVANDPNFETLWGVPHNRSFKYGAKMFDLPYVFVDDEISFKNAVADCLNQRKPVVIEMKTDRKINAESHRKLKEELLC
jgi:2-succinyl-5-enolpyruvyl-6-hydroxy-3-cyclohexene-1-carboxylate synthase